MEGWQRKEAKDLGEENEEGERRGGKEEDQKESDKSLSLAMLRQEVQRGAKQGQ